jgi:hypothetical protein
MRVWATTSMSQRVLYYVRMPQRIRGFFRRFLAYAPSAPPLLLVVVMVATLAGLVAVSLSAAIDAGRPADLNSFELGRGPFHWVRLNHDYGQYSIRRSGMVQFAGVPIAGVDPDTFEISLNDRGEITRYAKDDAHVWYLNVGYYGDDLHMVVDSIAAIPGANPRTFTPFFSVPVRPSQPQYFSYENAHLLYDSYAVDGQRVYYEACPIVGMSTPEFKREILNGWPSDVSGDLPCSGDL